MKKLYLCSFMSVAVLNSGLVFADNKETNQGQVQTSNAIGTILTAGNRGISSTEILSKVRSRAGELFDPAMAAEDVKRIAQLPGVEYSYYNTAVIENKVQLTFVVVEKNIIRSINFLGNRKIKANALRKKLDFKIADYLDPVLAEAGRKTLVEFYHKNGFVFAEVTLDSEQLPYGKLIYSINEGPKVKIESVSFSGNRAIKTNALKKTIKTKKDKFIFWPNFYTEESLTKDVTKLQNVYYERGFLDAKINPKLKFNEDKSKVRITFIIEEGPAYTVDKIIVTGNTHFDEKQLREGLKLKEGQIYNERKAKYDVGNLLKLYRENGFIDVKVERRHKFTSPNTVSVEFEITQGGRFRIGRIDITGNEQTQDKVVRRILDEYDFQPGQWYNADIARGDGSGYLEKEVGRTVLTETKTSTITPSGDMPGQRNAQVNIIEGQTGSVMLGAGVASDSGIMGQLIFEQRNFDIKDRPKSFSDLITGRAFRGAGQILRIALEPGTELSRYSINFTEPYFKNKPVSLDVLGESYMRIRESYDENRLRGYLGFEKRYKDHWRRSIGFRVENVNIDDIEYDAPKEIKDMKGNNSLAGIKLGIGRDLTDDKFTPSKGSIFNASYEQVAGDYTFGILSGTHRYYKTLYEDLAERKTILATRLHAAAILGDAPAFEKFYAGGSTSIRGFEYRGVSTRGVPWDIGGAIPGRKKKDPIGSDWIFLASTEVVVPLVSDNFGLLLFVDSGAIDTGGFRASVGTGIQILLPQWFGPVPMRFEVATPFMKDGDDDTQFFSFSVGRLF